MLIFFCVNFKCDFQHFTIIGQNLLIFKNVFIISWINALTKFKITIIWHVSHRVPAFTCGLEYLYSCMAYWNRIGKSSCRVERERTIKKWVKQTPIRIGMKYVRHEEKQTCVCVAYTYTTQNTNQVSIHSVAHTLRRTSPSHSSSPSSSHLLASLRHKKSSSRFKRIVSYFGIFACI